MTQAATDVLAIELAAPDHGVLPAWEPGAHLDLRLPSGAVGKYSLCGDPTVRDRYRIGVLRTHPDGLSAQVHALRVGQSVSISPPRNHFPLVLAEQYLFLAAGIGITPILPMLRAATLAGRDWQLLYAGRTRTRLAFLDEVLGYGTSRVHIVTDDVNGPPDLPTVLTHTTPGTTVYACGPAGLLEHLADLISQQFPDRHLHQERFGPASREARPGPDTGFDAELRRSGRLLHVPGDRGLLDVILEAVPDTPYSCRQGYCGTCALRVIDGVPDHRDHLPTAEQRHDLIYPCVSRSRSSRLVLDL